MTGPINNNKGSFQGIGASPFIGVSPFNSKYTIIPPSLRPGSMATTQPDLLKGTINQGVPRQNMFKSKAVLPPTTGGPLTNSVYSNPLSSMRPNPMGTTNPLLSAKVVNPKDLSE